MHFFYVSVAWRSSVLANEILNFKGILRVGNPARAFAAPMQAENTLIFGLLLVNG